MTDFTFFTGEDLNIEDDTPCLLNDVCVMFLTIHLPFPHFLVNDLIPYDNCFSFISLDWKSLSLCLHQKCYHETTALMRVPYSHRFSPEVGMTQVKDNESFFQKYFGYMEG